MNFSVYTLRSSPVFVLNPQVAPVVHQETMSAESHSEKTDVVASPKTTSKKDSTFWLSYLAVILSTFLGALDLVRLPHLRLTLTLTSLQTAVSTTLPTITHDLHGDDDFVWIGSAYALSSTAFLPLSGSLANAFGRRPVMLGSIALFALGSALAGSAHTMTTLIAARSMFLHSQK